MQVTAYTLPRDWECGSIDIVLPHEREAEIYDGDWNRLFKQWSVVHDQRTQAWLLFSIYSLTHDDQGNSVSDQFLTWAFCCPVCASESIAWSEVNDDFKSLKKESGICISCAAEFSWAAAKTATLISTLAYDDAFWREYAATLQRNHAHRIHSNYNRLVRAEETLTRCLTDEQRAQLLRQFSFFMTASDGRVYEIEYGDSGNVILYDLKVARKIRLCAHPEMIRETYPWADSMLAQKLALDTDADSFLKTANNLSFPDVEITVYARCTNIPLNWRQSAATERAAGRDYNPWHRNLTAKIELPQPRKPRQYWQLRRRQRRLMADRLTCLNWAIESGQG